MKGKVFWLIFIFLGLFFFSSSLYASQEEEALELFLKGKEYYESGNYKEAIKYLRKAISIIPNDGEIRIKKQKVVNEEKCKYIPIGRTVKETCETVPVKKDFYESYSYYPNKILKEIAKLTAPPYLEVQVVEFSDENSNRIFEAGEKVYLTVKVINKGKGVSPETKLKIESPIFGTKVVDLGDIDPGSVVKKSLTFTVPVRVKTGKQILKVEVLAGEYSPEPIMIVFNTKAPIPPHFQIAYSVDDDTVGESVGNGNGIIEPRETIELHVSIKNVGKGFAKDVRIVLSSSDVIVRKGEVEIGNLPPGGQAEGKFVFFVPADYQKDKIKFSLEVHEGLGLWTARHSLVFNIKKHGSKIIELAGGVTLPSDEETESFRSEILPVSSPKLSAKCVKPNPNFYFFGVIVADYYQLEKLDYVKNDEKLIKELAECYIGVPEENLKILENPTYIYFKSELRKFVSRIIRKDARLYFYYSGHGVMDSKGNFYLLPVDASIDNEEMLKESGIDLNKLKEILSWAKGKKLAFIDACRIEAPWKPAVMVHKPKLADNIAFVFSTKEGQISNTDKEREYSAFTRALYEMAKAGITNIDLNGDGYVEIKELFKPLRHWVRRVSADPNQEPDVWGNTNLEVFPVE